MRKYAVADIHGKIETIKKIRAVVDKESLDLIILAGDITQYLFPSKSLDLLAKIDIPMVAVRGNSDMRCVEPLILRQKKIRLLNQDPMKFQGKNFIGLHGTLPLPFISKVCLNETGQFKKIEAKTGPDTILVVHPPPRGICDKAGNRFSVGSFHLKRFIETLSPFMVICGHVHEQAGYQYFKNTLIVNCAVNKTFTGAIIDCRKDEPINIKMVLNE